MHAWVHYVLLLLKVFIATEHHFIVAMATDNISRQP